MEDMQQQMNQNQTNSKPEDHPQPNKDNHKINKDYIDFEEIK